MRLNFQNLFALLLLTLVGLGCRSCDTMESNKLVQSEIYQDYTIDATKNSTNASATFRAGGSTGTTIALTAPSGVQYNGKAMSENLRSIVAGTYYSASSNIFTGEHQFAYTNGDGTVFKNDVTFQPIELVNPPKDLTRGKETVIALSRPLAEGESLDTSITSTVENQGMTGNSNSNSNANPALTYYQNLNGNYDAGKKAIVISASNLANFAPGPADIVVKIRASKAISQKTHLGGMITYTYTTQAHALDILK